MKMKEYRSGTFIAGHIQMTLFILCLTGLMTLGLPSGALAADDSKCIYPSPDGFSLDSSPQTVKGKIVQIKPNAIMLKPESSSEPEALQHKQIKIDKKTKIFTLSGEYVAMSELAPGQDAYIWYEGCRLPKKGQLPYAAVVKIEKKQPNKN